MDHLANLIELYKKSGLEPAVAVDKAREDVDKAREDKARREENRHKEAMAKIALETAKTNAENNLRQTAAAQVNGGGLVVGLGGIDDALAMALRQKYTPQVFNAGQEKTDPAGSLASDVKRICRYCCVVCGTNERVSLAHILKRRSDCEKLRIPFDVTNFLALCGTDGVKNTCHDFFDKFQMSFVHTATTGQWAVVGGGVDRHGKLVNLATNPHKRALHSHFSRCMLNKSLLIDEQFDISPDDLNVSDDFSDEIA